MFENNLLVDFSVPLKEPPFGLLAHSRKDYWPPTCVPSVPLLFSRAVYAVRGAVFIINDASFHFLPKLKGNSLALAQLAV